MNINRHNYEEFFLLYVDNELSAADKKAVDVFVQQNPDLQGELLSLQQAVVKADDIVLEKKDWLFMEEGVSALQENLLLYADDELSPADKRTVSALLATDKTARVEWHILQQTKFQPDTAIVFTDKRSLYRTEAGRVVGFKWWRVAAAAILLGIALWTGVTVYKNNFKATTGTDKIAKDNKTTPGEETKTNTAENKIAAEIQPKDNVVDPQSTTITIAPKNTKEQTTEKIDQPVDKIIKKNTNDQKDNIVVEKPSNNLPKSYLENINREKSNEIATQNVKPENINSITGSGINEAIVKVNPSEKIKDPVIDKDLTDPKTTAAIPVMYTGDENNNDRILYMDEDKVKRTKLGGLLRKAKRMVERTTNIKTGDGLKVAGFEIALK